MPLEGWQAKKRVQRGYQQLRHSFCWYEKRFFKNNKTNTFHKNKQQQLGDVMQAPVLYRIFKGVGYVVLVLGVAAILYASVISITYWHGIGV